MKFYYLQGKNNQYIARDPTGKMYLVSNLDEALLLPISEKKKIMTLKNNNIPNVLKKFGPFNIMMMNTDDESEKITANDMADEIIESLNNFSDNIEQFSSYQEELNSIVSYTDLELSDILHYIEFHKFSASEGYKLCKKIQEICDRRREAKNKLRLICTMKTQSCQKILSGDAVRDISNAAGVKGYTPRVLEKMFEENLSKERAEKSVRIKFKGENKNV